MGRFSKEAQLTNNVRIKTKRKEEGLITDEAYQAAFKRDKGHCAVCGSRKWLECHHIKPRGKGGSGNDPSNLIILCKHCHYTKIHSQGDYNTKKKVYEYMIRKGYDYSKDLELLELEHKLKNN